jgi:HlyD family secretion protein
MFVIAEVYETDIGRVRLGQKARISGPLVPDGVSGNVIHVASQISKSELLPTDPASFADTRVLKVKIQLDNAERVAGLIHGKVDVVIEP